MSLFNQEFNAWFCHPKCWSWSSAGMAQPKPSSTAPFRSDFSCKSWCQHHSAAQPGSECLWGGNFISETYVSEGYCIILINLPLFLSTLQPRVESDCHSDELSDEFTPELLCSEPGSKSYVLAHECPLGELQRIRKDRSYPVVLLLH